MLKYSELLKRKYGEKVYKISINVGGTCPNRDGAKGVGGCAFCSEIGAGFELLPQSMSVYDQMNTNINFIGTKYKAKKFIIYFQNYTTTYLPIEAFKSYLEIIKPVSNVVGIAVSTRPDCLDGGHLELLEEFSSETGFDIFIELGLQSSNDNTLKKINRCHTVDDFIKGAQKVKLFGFYLDIHIILNLPWDTDEDIQKTAEIINQIQPTSIKLHSLHIPYKTPLYEMYKNNEFEVISKDAYFHRLDIILSSIKNDEIAIQRLFSRAPKESAAFCNWSTSWWKLEDQFFDYMRRNGKPEYGRNK